jgi:hypothetical protein
MTVAAGATIDATDITALQGYTTGRPLVRLIASGTQSIPHNTQTALTFTGAEDIDTHGYHDTATNTSRVTPLTAGYYRARGVVYFGTRADYTLLEASIGKNGTTIAPSGRRIPPLITGVQAVEAVAIVSVNGTTDYIEVYGLHINSAAAAQVTNQSGRFSSVLEVEFLRPL